MLVKMIVCPLCDHPQAGGDECEVCGKKLSGFAAAATAIPRLEGLEPSRLDAAPDVAVESVPGLEPTHHPPVAGGADVAPDIEPTRAEPVTIAVELVPGLEHTQPEPIPGEGTTALPVTPVCRYCRTPALPGEVLCGLCGMRLPVFRTAVEDAGQRPVARCPSCGTLGTAEICSGCGSMIRFSS